ncbi:hypothetical protein V8F20_004151 [Naviculisporaceae sp. PSN 640]
MAPVGTEDTFDGNDFSNNLFSDLAPLLSLFGEQVTKQFMSVSLGWADHILLGMGPIGIMTIVVSAIRVAGTPLLKSLVGRIYHDVQIRSSTQLPPLPLLGIERARESGIYKFTLSSSEFWRLPPYPPPNLTLNLRSQSPSSWTSWLLAVFGIMLQLGALGVSGIATYMWNWSPLDSDNAAPRFAYPLYCGGSLLMFAGVIACGYIVDSGTGERYFKCMPENPDITVSFAHEASGDYWARVLTPFATAVSMCGFITQFVGLRNLHWSVTIIQLGVTLIMTAIRAWVRRGLSDGLPFARADSPSTYLIGYLVEWKEAIWPWFLFGILSAAEDPRHPTDPNHWEEPGTSLLHIYVGTYATRVYPRHLAHALNTRPSSRFSLSRPQKDENENWDRKMALVRQLVSAMDTPEVPSSKVTEAARMVEEAAFAVLETLRREHKGSIYWRENSEFADGGLEEARDLFWTLDVVEKTGYEYIIAYRDIFTLSPVSIAFQGRLADRGRDDVTELEGFIFYSYYSLALEYTRTERFWRDTPLSENDKSWDIPRRFARVLGTNPPHKDCPTFLLSEWLNRPVSEIDCPNGQSKLDGAHPASCEPYQEEIEKMRPPPYFGMYLSSMSSDNIQVPEGPFSEQCEPPRIVNSDLAIVDLHRTTYLQQMARELFSLFILALAAEINEVRGVTMETADRPWANSFFDDLGNEAVRAGLATDLDDALTLLIPAFARYNLLPREYTLQYGQERVNTSSYHGEGAAHGDSGAGGVRRRGAGGGHLGEGGDEGPSG